jgi:hypothetical protein
VHRGRFESNPVRIARCRLMVGFGRLAPLHPRQVDEVPPKDEACSKRSQSTSRFCGFWVISFYPMGIHVFVLIVNRDA